MGNQFFTQCNKENTKNTQLKLPNIRQQNHQHLNQQQIKIRYSINQKNKNYKNLIKKVEYLTIIPKRSAQLDIIYKDLIREKELINSIQKQKETNKQIKIIMYQLLDKQNEKQCQNSIMLQIIRQSLDSTISQVQQVNKDLFQIMNKPYIYIGMLDEQNLPHGLGQLYSLNQIKPVFMQCNFYHGNIQSDDCLIITVNGYYRGGFVNYHFQGKGKIQLSQSPNQLQIQGYFQRGLLQGKGKIRYYDGGCYEGTFLNGKRDGKGKMRWKSAENQPTQTKQILYQGYYTKDQMDGLGYLKTPNYQYWGPFKNNVKQGKGTIKFKNGNKFQGWFQKDQIHGYGQLHYPDGRIQKAIFPIPS